MASVLGSLARQDPERAALIFLEDGSVESGRLSRAQLHRSAMRAAAALRERGLVGERVLLAFPSSLDYVVAFLGCLYAGTIGVPVYPPRQNWHSKRLAAIARDADARLALTSSALCDEVQKKLGNGPEPALQTLSLDALTAVLEHDHPGWVNESVAAHELAYLQYTSGSTGDPKGVMISHANLASNCAFIARCAGLEPGGAFVSWLPLHHDMGLVAGTVLPLMLGASAVLMPPAAFVQQPLRWLHAIQTYRASFSAAPNFAYDLCAARITEEQTRTLDLSSWQVALNGAEPLRSHTLDAFHGRFAACGVNPGLISGGYGMAEATLVVTIGARAEVAARLRIDRSDLTRGRVTPRPFADPAHTTLLVSSGHVQPGCEVRIVRPHDHQACAPHEVGEIWVSSPCTGRGYWRKEQDTESTFRARIRGEPGQTWLRTGDLGFVHEGQLYVTGRLKDLVIIRGSNHYPQDLERIAEQSWPGLRHGGYNAAFSIEDEGTATALVLVQEVERTARKTIDTAAAGRAIADAIAREHGIAVDMVVLVAPASVPKTSSGKVQRSACREALQAGQLSEVGRWKRSPGEQQEAPAPASDVMAWLCGRLAGKVGRHASEIDPQQPFSEFGLDSVRLIEFIEELSLALGRKLPASLLFDHPNAQALARHLAGDQATRHEPDKGHGQAAIAIVGIACRVPGAQDVDAFWQLLDEGSVAIGEVPPERARLTGWAAASDAPHRFVAMIDKVEQFDAALFGISPREASGIDPQQRLLLETAWHALERAQIAPDSLAGTSTGVFIGISTNDYYRLQRAHGSGLDAHAGTGGAPSIAANRLSYVFGLQGPSMAIDTACSSSLVAIHQACRSLAAGESTLALAGGVNLVLCEDLGTAFERAGMLAPDGRCKTFDAQGNGYVRGEGAACWCSSGLTTHCATATPCSASSPDRPSTRMVPAMVSRRPTGWRSSR